MFLPQTIFYPVGCLVVKRCQSVQQGTDECILPRDQIRGEDSKCTLVTCHVFLFKELVCYRAQVLSPIHDSFYHSVRKRETSAASKNPLVTIRYVCP